MEKKISCVIDEETFAALEDVRENFLPRAMQPTQSDAIRMALDTGLYHLGYYLRSSWTNVFLEEAKEKYGEDLPLFVRLKTVDPLKKEEEKG